MKSIIEAMRERVLLGDGAMGTMLQEGGLPAGACPEEAVLSRPSLVAGIHRRYIESGAEVIETNTFGANRRKLADYGLAGEVERINREAVRLARKAAPGWVYVAGAVGPLGAQLAPLGALTFEEAVEEFGEQLRALARAGVDAVFLETFSDIREAKAALAAASGLPGIPVIAHMTFGEDGRTFSGTPPDAAAVTLSAMGAAAVGTNCSLGPEGMLPVIGTMAASTQAPLSVFPNAGLPELVDGATVFRKGPAEMAAFVDRFVSAGVSLLGGCCGTTPAHIAAMAAALGRRRPARRAVPPLLRLCSRTRTVVLDPGKGPLVIGERINLSVRASMARSFILGDTAELRDASIAQAREGAHALDLNAGAHGESLGVGAVSEADLISRVVRLVQRCVDVPLVIDSNDPDAVAAGLGEVEGRALVNSVTADADSMPRLLSIARAYGAAIIVLPLSGSEMPESAAGRVKLAEEVMGRALDAGVRAEDILVDPLVMAAAASQEQPGVAIEALRMMKARGWRTVLGLSNVSHGLPERSSLNAAFLAMAVGAGLDAVICNPSDELVMRTLRAARVLAMRDAGAREFMALSGAPPSAPAPAKTAALPARDRVKERLLASILAGDRDGVIPAVEEALAHGIPPLEINISMLAPALEEVGARFERRDIFLPQMILAAETVQAAFARLKREMKGERIPSRGRIVMATVLGDVHDIGKNICCTVLENYGYEIVDLGRNVPAEVIAEQAAAAKASLIGLSALMTTTMRQMESVIAEVRRRGMPQKVMVGGAVVTPAYARKIGADGYARNAGEIVRLVKRLSGAAGPQPRA
jgi:5-methyltetrahydrofolate--homocysteine methyltransferase